MNIGQRIKERRTQLGMSAEKLGDILGKNRSTIYRYENGDIENMPIEILEPIAKALHTTPAFLMGWNQAEIDAASETQKDANEYEDAEEEGLKSLYVEFGGMHLTDSEIRQLKTYAQIMRNQEINYGSVIKEARKEKGYTIEQLAEKIGVSPDEAIAYENNSLFPVNKLKELYFTLDITYFMMLGIRQHFDETYQKIYSLELSSDELKEVYEYAKYLKAKRK